MSFSRWQVKLGDEDLGVFDENTFTVSDAFVLEGTADITVVEMLHGVPLRMAKASRALIWFMKYKQGNPPHISTVDFNLADLEMQAIPDPTVAEPEPDETVTSELSPTTSI